MLGKPLVKIILFPPISVKHIKRVRQVKSIGKELMLNLFSVLIDACEELNPMEE